MSDLLVKQLNDLASSLEALKVTDISAEYDELLLPETRAALSKQYKTIIGGCQHCGSEPFNTLYISGVVKKKEHVGWLVGKLLEQLELVSFYNVILGHLAQLSTIELYDGAIALFIFPTVKASFDPYHFSTLLDMRFFTRVGDIGVEVMDPEVFDAEPAAKAI